jgi:predicted P-loop ATPase
MISAVARIMDPGCKADCALILEGDQGRKKSSALRELAGSEWFTDQISDLGSKDASEDLRGKWIIEFAELKNIKGPEVEKIKAFLSRSTDHYRPPYARRARDFARQCVFAGSTNEDHYLHDRTGNRRFWPVKVEHIDLVRIREMRDQLWAEAVARYDKGEQWWLTEQETAIALVEQASRTEEDTWSSFIVPWLVGRVEATTREVMIECLGFEKKDINRSQETRIGQALRDAGFRSTERRHPIYGSRIYVRRP